MSKFTDMPTSTAKERKAYKLAVAAELHSVADDKDWCSTFDGTMNELGLPARPHVVEDRWTDYKGDDIVEGERSKKAFEAWKSQTSKRLHELGAEYGVYNYEQRLADLGFTGSFRDVDIVVKGTFEVPQTVRVWEDEDVIEGVVPYRVGAAVRNVIVHGEGVGPGSVEWKATVKS